MENLIALVTGITSGLGYAAASLLATKGYRQFIVTGRSLAWVKEMAAQLAAETKNQVFTPSPNSSSQVSQSISTAQCRDDLRQ